MRIKCKQLLEGPGPSEEIVAVTTADGTLEEVVVYTGLVKDGYLQVGPVLGKEADKVLVELPRESASGRWRIWVRESETAKEAVPA
jgi:hypothetical protein